METFIFTQEEAKKLFDDNTSVREYKSLQEKADSRFQYIMEAMSKIIGRDWEWYDFKNENSSNIGSPIRGFFDKDNYETEISFVGKFKSTKNERFDDYDYSFPTKWLWTEFEADLKKEVDVFEAKNKAIEQKRLNTKNTVKNIADNVKALQHQIYAKIPSDMRNNFTFKSPEQIYKEKLDAANAELEAARKLLKEQEDYLRSILTPEEFEVIQFKKPEAIVAKSKSHKPKM